MFVSLNEGVVVELEVSRKSDGSGWTTREISRALAAADPASGMLGTEGGEHYITQCLRSQQAHSC